MQARYGREMADRLEPIGAVEANQIGNRMVACTDHIAKLLRKNPVVHIQREAAPANEEEDEDEDMGYEQAPQADPPQQAGHEEAAPGHEEASPGIPLLTWEPPEGLITPPDWQGSYSIPQTPVTPVVNFPPVGDPVLTSFVDAPVLKRLRDDQGGTSADGEGMTQVSSDPLQPEIEIGVSSEGGEDVLGDQTDTSEGGEDDLGVVTQAQSQQPPASTDGTVTPYHRRPKRSKKAVKCGTGGHIVGPGQGHE